MKKIILVDGNNLLFRSYFATSYSGVIMKNSKGFPTNALYGFITMMNKIIQEENPSYILVAFDKGKTFRHQEYEAYKAGRAEMPEELRVQLPKAREVLDAMGIQHFEIENYEADDIIGTVAKQVDLEEEFVATIISSDKDLLQLISDEVEVKLLKKNDFIRMNKETFQQTYGFDPIHIIDLKALMGDSSDNIPGVKGIGEKTATTLLNKYKDLDDLYAHLDELTPKTKEKLEQEKENAYLSYHLATIYRDVPLPFTLETLQYNGYHIEEYIQLLQEFEFASLLKKIELPTQEKKEISISKKTVQEIKNFIPDHPFAFYLEMDGMDYNKNKVLGISICDQTNKYFIPENEILSYANLFESTQEKYTYDLKKATIVLNRYGIQLKQVTFDTMIATYLLDYDVRDDIAYVAKDLGYLLPFFEDSYGSVKRPHFMSVEETKKECLEKVEFIWDTKEELEKQLKENGEDALFREIEMPLALVLIDMEQTGIRVNKDYLSKLEGELSKEIAAKEAQIYEDAGCKFNIMSPKQLGEILFEKLEIPYPKKKVGERSYSTSKDILEKVLHFHPIIEKILDYRILSKLYATYAVGLKEEIREDGKIHTVFNQTLTRTGRLSSVRPNLQNIPIRTEAGKLIRKAFIPEENSVLLSSDYSQVELRMFAHIANAKGMIEAFEQNQDIHSKTAADIFHVPIDQVTSNMRRTAKAVNFGIIYGISSFGLSEDLKIDVSSAKKFLDTYWETYPGIKEYMEEEKEEAYKNGYAKTIMNRKRMIKELQSKNYAVRSGGERIALNTPIQGSAADILKKAMIEIYETFQKRNLKSKMLIQVHDELVFNVLKEELEEVSAIVKDIMENVVSLRVPLLVDIKTGSDWYEAK